MDWKAFALRAQKEASVARSSSGVFWKLVKCSTLDLHLLNGLVALHVPAIGRYLLINA